MPNVRADGVDLDHLRAVARHQRSINLAILAQIGIYVVALGLQPASSSSFVPQLVIGLAALAVAVFSIVATVRLANTMHGTGIAVLCAILMFAPCINLLTLLVLNQQATARVKKAGFKVGILGANPDDIR
jgi:hypothetical protein